MVGYFCLYIKAGSNKTSKYFFELQEVSTMSTTIYATFPSYCDKDIDSIAEGIAKILNTIIPGLKVKKLKIEKGLNRSELPTLSLIRKYRRTGIKHIIVKSKEDEVKKVVQLAVNE
jgi:hypothetical protein